MVLRVSTGQMFQHSLQQMQLRQVEANDLVRKISSGRAYLRPSENPFVAARALELEQVVSRTGQFQENTVLAEARLGLEETILTDVTRLLQRSFDLAVQANNGSLGDEDRQAIANEVRERFTELLQLGNTVDANGDYLFAGFSGDTTTLNARRIGNQDFVDYQGDQGRRLVAIGESRQIADGDNGAEVFFRVPSNSALWTATAAANTGSGEAAPAYVFDPTLATGDTYRIQFNAGGTYDVVNETDAVNVAVGVAYVDGADIEFDGLRTAITGAPAVGDVWRVRSAANQDIFTTLNKFVATLESSGGTPAEQARISAALGQSIDDLDGAIEHIATQRTDIGGRLNALAAQRDENDAYVLQTQATLSDLRDLDFAEAIGRLEQTVLALEAAQRSFARVQNLSLFNFLG